MLELDAQNPCLDGVEPTVVPLDIVTILLGLAVVPQHTDQARERFVVCGHGTRLPAGAQILPWIEAERSGATHRASPPPAMLLLREIQIGRASCRERV